MGILTAINVPLQGAVTVAYSGTFSSTDYIIFQKRKYGDTTWINFAKIAYEDNPEVTDKYVQNDYTYEYAIIPVAGGVNGSQIVSEEVTVNFDGIFLSDLTYNYHLLYDIEYSPISHNVENKLLIPIHGQYPTPSFSQFNYKTFSIKHTSVSSATAISSTNTIDIEQEKLTRDTFISFLKNRKLKVYRNDRGEIALVGLSGSPSIEPYSNITIAKVSFDLVEMESIDDYDTLIANNLLEWAS